MIPTNRHPWFAPLYRRLAVVAVCFGWLALEAYGGEQIWFYAAVGITGYAVWALLISYKATDASGE
jgi:hypothetical protein